MSTTDTTDRLIRELRSTDKPALSASDLAEKLDVSVRTINNHVTTLVEDGRIESTQIGNAQAYYVTSSDLPAHKKPDHTCARCGREIRASDHAKIEYTAYFEDRPYEPGVADFFIFCRFCYSDFISWAHHDEGAMGDYPHVHSWGVPQEQLEEVREDPDIETKPSTEFLQSDQTELYDLIVEMVEESEEEWLWNDDVMSAATGGDEIREIEMNDAMDALQRIGLVEQSGGKIRLAK
jgi:DNA-binding Lrp family transcriptional regulator